MSGGSYNYLINAFDTELFERASDLEAMASDLEAAYPGSLAAADTRSLLIDIGNAALDAEARAAALRDVWHAQEWYQSNDYGPDAVATAVAKYAAEQQAGLPDLIVKLRALAADDALRAAPGALLARRIEQLLRNETVA